MSTLIESMMTPCVKLEKTSTQDGVLGHLNTWRPIQDSGFMAAIIRKENMQAEAAERPALQEVYTVVVPTGTQLGFYDVFRRESDGAVFRVTGDVRDMEAPAMSTVQISKTTAERWIPE